MTNPVTEDRRHFEDLALGETIALGPRTVSKDDIFAFARTFDPFPFHLDEKAARASLLGGLAASGWQTGAFSLRMLVDGFLGDVASMGAVGFENLKWRKPVFVNDTLSGRATISGLRRSRSHSEMGLVTFDFDMRNQKDEPVLTMRLTHLVQVRDPAVAMGGSA